MTHYLVQSAGSRFYWRMILIITFPLYIGACLDSEKPCLDSNPEFLFIGVDAFDVDTIRFIAYEKGSSFGLQMNQFLSLPGCSNSILKQDTLFLVQYICQIISDTFDWEIHLLPLDKHFYITDLVYEDKTCGCKGFLAIDCFNFDSNYWKSAVINGESYTWPNATMSTDVVLNVK